MRGILFLVLLILGCSGPYEATVSGNVTLDGQLLTSGAVTFHSVTGGPAVIGAIRDDGSYRLRIGETEGLPPGEYLVTAKSISGPPGDMMTPAELDALSITPVRYGNKKTTDLKFTVEPGRNEINIALVSD